MSRNDRRGWIVFGALLAGIGVYLFVLGDSTTFFRDEWSFIAYRDGRNAANILGSHQDQLVANFLLFYVGFFKGIGLDQYWLIRLLTLPLLLGSSFVIYFIGSRRMGAWAIAPALIILLLGTAWQTLLWPLGIFAFSAVCFLGTSALLAMERDNWKWDLAAFLLLMSALGMNGLTLAFLVGGALGLLMLPKPGWKRLWIVVIPGAVYLLWSHFYRTVPVDFGSTIGGAPHFAWDLAINGVSGFTGLTWTIAEVATVALAVFILVRLIQVGRDSPIAWQATAVLLTYLVLTALARTSEGSPFAVRYIFPTVFLLLVVLVAVAPRDNLKIMYSVGLTVLVAVVLPHNVRQLVDGSNGLKESAVITRTELGAIELSRGFVPLDATMDLREYPIPANNYLTAVDRFESSPAYNRAELMAAPELARQSADRVVALAEGLITPAGAGSARRLTAGKNLVCRRVSPGDTFTDNKLGSSEILVLGPWPETGIAIKRYASDFHLLPLPDKSGRYRIATPDADADPPWQVQVEASGSPVRVCGTG